LRLGTQITNPKQHPELPHVALKTPSFRQEATVRAKERT
jgi:hypothetical protein